MLLVSGSIGDRVQTFDGVAFGRSGQAGSTIGLETEEWQIADLFIVLIGSGFPSADGSHETGLGIDTEARDGIDPDQDLSFVQSSIRCKDIICKDFTACRQDHVQSAEEVDLTLRSQFGSEIESHPAVCIDHFIIIDEQVINQRGSGIIGQDGVASQFDLVFFIHIINLHAWQRFAVHRKRKNKINRQE